jgi:uncharacterized surface anchored protein
MQIASRRQRRKLKRGVGVSSFYFEGLEQRRMLSLLGVMPNPPVSLVDEGGSIVYTASTKSYTAEAVPTDIIFPDGTLDTIDAPTNFEVSISVNNDGTLAGSGSTPTADVTLSGSIDDPSELVYSGLLLTGTVTQFGYQDNGDGTAAYDFRFTPTGGELVTDGMFAGQDVGLLLTSENSTFQDLNPGDPGFTTDFTGEAKGFIGAIPQLDSISGVAYNDQNDNGTQDSGEPGINGVSITLSGTDENGNPVLETTTTTTIGGVAGSYDFTQLISGTYTITENATPAGYLDGQDSAGTDGGTVGPVGTNAISNINLDANETGDDNATGYDFASILPSTIAGNAYYDVNGNGVDNSEPGIGSVTVTLTGTNDLGQTVTDNTTTALNGTYSFTGLRPGDYSVTAMTPATYTPDSAANAGSLGGTASANEVASVVIMTGNTGTNYNFGYVQPATLNGTVYDDLNDNGVYDGSDTGIAGVTVTLTGSDNMGDSVSVTTTTGSNGSYSFTGVFPGTYDITETPPAGYLPGAVTAGSLGGTTASYATDNIAVSSGQTGNNYNFGEVQPSTLSGFVYNDANDNGVQDGGESGIAGVTITLTGTNDLGQSVSVTTTTASNGSYSFAGLRPGTYGLTETPPAGYLDGTDSAGSLGGTVGDDVISSIVIPPAGNATGTPYDFAELLPSSVSGVAYLDSNGNDVDDAGEAGISGLTVTLTGTNDHGASVTETTVTASGGVYSFTGLRPGTYTVTETPPAGYATEPGDVGSLSGTAGTESVSSISLTQNESGVKYNFGQYQTSSISGTVYNDVNQNDVDNSEPGIAGVTVTLTGTTGTGQSVTVTTTSASNGTYSFAGLAPGNYSVSETPPAGYITENANAGSLGGTAAVAAVTNVTVTSGESGTNYNFGQYVPASGTLSGNVYNDLNGNDVDNSEPGIAGVTVTLTGTTSTGGSVSLTTTSASNGSYSFSGLAAGTYTLTETPPAGYVTEKGDVGSIGGTAGTETVSSIALATGGSGTNYNFGQYQTSSLSGTVYNDLNGNDVDNTEPGIAGVTVTVTGTNGAGQSVTITTTTASNGTYSFSGLAPGVYTLTETPPAGYVTEKGDVGSLGGTAATAAVSSVTVTSGQAGTNYNFGQYQCSTISGTVYNDLNGNDTDNSEPGIAGVTVTLTGTNGAGAAVTVTTTSASNGTYSFTGLAPGNYTVTETPPAGYVTEAANAGSLGGTAAVAKVSNITVTSGETGTNYNFGQYQTASLSGIVYIDANSSDTYVATDAGLGGVTITLTGTTGSGGSVSLTTTTAANGTYSFTGLAPGVYTATETQPASYTAEKSNPGSLGGTASVGAISTVTIVSAASGVNYDFGEIQPLSDSIDGTVYTDLTGNGLTSDDTPLSGVTVQVYKDVNGTGVLESNDTLVATTVSAANGTYTFTNLPVGKYIVEEVTPSGYIETAPSNPEYYGVTVTNGVEDTGLNFDNYHECNVTPTCVSFKLSGGGCTTTTVTDLRGETAQGETVTVTFTIPAGSAAMTFSLVSYNAPDPVFNASDASEQTIYQEVSAVEGPGTHTLTVTIPSNYYQIDFVCGPAINMLGPAGSNIFYSAQNRLISADNGGVHSDVDDESATMLFWANLGQTLIKDFGGSSANTALGTWLATTYPNLFGGSILGTKTNAAVAAKYMSYYDVTGQQNNAQVMATALNVYASTLGLGGTTGTPFGFIPSAAGLGAADFDVSTNGSAFGVANNTTITVNQMLTAVNASASNGVLYNNITSLLNECYNQLAQVNGDGGIV